jgi:hypothetical protein
MLCKLKESACASGLDDRGKGVNDTGIQHFTPCIVWVEVSGTCQVANGILLSEASDFSNAIAPVRRGNVLNSLAHVSDTKSQDLVISDKNILPESSDPRIRSRLLNASATGRLLKAPSRPLKASFRLLKASSGLSKASRGMPKGSPDTSMDCRPDTIRRRGSPPPLARSRSDVTLDAINHTLDTLPHDRFFTMKSPPDILSHDMFDPTNRPPDTAPHARFSIMNSPPDILSHDMFDPMNRPPDTAPHDRFFTMKSPPDILSHDMFDPTNRPPDTAAHDRFFTMNSPPDILSHDMFDPMNRPPDTASHDRFFAMNSPPDIFPHDMFDPMKHPPDTVPNDRLEKRNVCLDVSLDFLCSPMYCPPNILLNIALFWYQHLPTFVRGSCDLQTQDVIGLLGRVCVSRACSSGSRRISFRHGIKPSAKASIRNSAIDYFSVMNNYEGNKSAVRYFIKEIRVDLQ